MYRGDNDLKQSTLDRGMFALEIEPVGPALGILE